MSFNNNHNSYGKSSLNYASRHPRITTSSSNSPNGVSSITLESAASIFGGRLDHLPSSHVPLLPYSLSGMGSSSLALSPSDPNYLVSILEDVIDIVNRDIMGDADDSNEDSFANSGSKNSQDEDKHRRR